MGIEIAALKNRPDHSLSKMIRSHLKALEQASDRLAANYTHFDPWSDPTVISFDLVMDGPTPVSFGALQTRPAFPIKTYRANSRHYLFPQFRSNRALRTKIGILESGSVFGGALIRHHIRLAKDMGAHGVFVSRDRGWRSFSFFMRSRVNALIPDTELHLRLLENMKFNTCGNILAESCWQYIAAISFSQKTALELMQEMPFRHEPVRAQHDS